MSTPAGASATIAATSSRDIAREPFIFQLPATMGLRMFDRLMGYTRQDSGRTRTWTRRQATAMRAATV